VTPAGEPESFTTPEGLAGVAQDIRFEREGSPPGLRRTILLGDERYHYPIEITSYAPDRWQEHVAAGANLVTTIRAVPPSARAAAARPALQHWLD
jgi:hypothetical protein